MGIANITNNILTDSGVTIGAAGGVATLDSGGKIPVSQLPNSVMEFKGTWSAATNTPTLANGTGNAGDVYEVSDAGTVNFGAGGIAFAVGDYVVYDGANWQYSSGQKGTITSLTFSAPLTGGTITTSGTVGIPAATSTVDGYLKASDWVIFNGKQNALTNPVTGTGTTNYVTKFTGASTVGNSLIFDNGTKVGIGTSSIPTSRFLAVSGSAQFNGAALMEGANFSIVPAANGQDGVVLNVGYDTGTDYGSLFINTGGNTSMTLTKNGAVTFASSATATSFVKTGGTSAQFLKADGSVDSSTYVSSSALASYLPLAGGTLTGMLNGKTFIFTTSTNSAPAGIVENLGSTDAHGLYVNIGSSSTGFGFRVDKNGSPLFTVANSGAATFSSSVGISGSPSGTYGTLSVFGGISIKNDNNAKLEIGRYSTGAPNSYIKLGASSGALNITNNTDTADIFTFINAGSLGINTASPVNTAWGNENNTKQLSIESTGYSVINLQGATGRKYSMGVGDGIFYMCYDNTAARHNIIVFSSGNVGINATSDGGYKLDVIGTSRVTGAATFSNSVTAASGTFYLGDSINGTYFLGGSGNTARQLKFSTSTTTNVGDTHTIDAQSGSGVLNFAITSAIKMTIANSGNVGIGTTPLNKFTIRTGTGNNWDFYNGGSSGAGVGVQSVNDANTVYQPMGFFASSYTFNNGAATFAASVTSDGLFKSNQGVFQVFAAGTFRGGLYNYASASGSGTDYSPTLVSETSLYFATGGSATKKLTIDSAGAATFSSNLTVNGIYYVPSTSYFIGNAAQGFRFNNAADTLNLLIIKDNGNVLIGNSTDPGYRLYVKGESIVANNAGRAEIRLQGGGYGTNYNTSLRSETGATGVLQFGNNGQNTVLIGNTNTGGYLDFRTNCNSESTASGSISLRLNSNATAEFYSSVTATAFFESSDATIKTLITDNYQTKGIESVVAKLYTKNGKEELGYYAQDVQGILPSAVSKGTDGLLSLSYREVHTAKIARLEKELEELKAKLN
jgi:hypothetical protein